MAGDVALFATSGNSPMYRNGTMVVGVNQQGVTQELATYLIPSSWNDVSFSGRLQDRYDDPTFYGA